jgi:predicted amidohydrolase
MTDSLTIAVLQRTVIPHDPASNLLGALEMLHACAKQQVELFVMTELWPTGMLDSEDGSASELVEDLSGPTVEALRGFCRDAGAYLLAGTLPLKQGGKLRNVALLIDPSGNIILQYAKTQLFSPMGEDDVFTAGDSLAAADVNGVKVGVLICYDIRFPSLARSLAKSGCEIILVPALWPQERIEHWETLIRARAIENQVLMVGANGIMNQDDAFFPGRSLIVAPDGGALNTPEMRETAIV